MQRPDTALIAELHELHGFMIEEVHIGDMESGTLALQFGDGSRAFFAISLGGSCELTTSHDIINRLAGQRIESVRARTDFLPDGEDAANGDYALYMTIRTTDGGPIITLVWNIYPAADDLVDAELILDTWLDPKLADATTAERASPPQQAAQATPNWSYRDRGSMEIATLTLGGYRAEVRDLDGDQSEFTITDPRGSTVCHGASCLGDHFEAAQAAAWALLQDYD